MQEGGREIDESDGRPPFKAHEGREKARRKWARVTIIGRLVRSDGLGDRDAMQEWWRR